MLGRWMLVLEDPDQDRLYLARGVPREWVASGKQISIAQAPTRWGRINFSLIAKPASKAVVATVELARPGAPKELHVKLRLPEQTPLRAVTVNGRLAVFAGDTVHVQTGTERHFEIVGQFS